MLEVKRGGGCYLHLCILSSYIRAYVSTYVLQLLLVSNTYVSHPIQSGDDIAHVSSLSCGHSV